MSKQLWISRVQGGLGTRLCVCFGRTVCVCVIWDCGRWGSDNLGAAGGGFYIYIYRFNAGQVAVGEVARYQGYIR